MSDTKEILNALEKHAGEITTKLSGFADKYGPDVVEGAFNVVRLMGIDHLKDGLLLLILSGGLSLVIYHWFKYANEMIEKDSDYASAHAVTVIAVMVAGTTYVIGFAYLFNIWNWVALIEPKLWLAHKLMGL